MIGINVFQQLRLGELITIDDFSYNLTLVIELYYNLPFMLDKGRERHGFVTPLCLINITTVHLNLSFTSFYSNWLSVLLALQF
jgi:hypothetical protein